MVLSICKKLNASTYLTGSGGLEYLKIDEFEQENISVETVNYNFKEYNQINSKDEFIPHLSIMDLVFNEGKNAINFL